MAVRPSRLARIERPGNFGREASDTKEDSDHLIDYDDTPSQLLTLRFFAISNSLLPPGKKTPATRLLCVPFRGNLDLQRMHVSFLCTLQKFERTVERRKEF